MIIILFTSYAVTLFFQGCYCATETANNENQKYPTSSGNVIIAVPEFSRIKFITLLLHIDLKSAFETRPHLLLHALERVV